MDFFNGLFQWTFHFSLTSMTSILSISTLFHEFNDSLFLDFNDLNPINLNTFPWIQWLQWLNSQLSHLPDWQSCHVARDAIASKNKIFFSLAESISHEFSHFMGLLLWFLYQFLLVIILMNILIAMMTTTFTKISETADTQWKYRKSFYQVEFLHSKTITILPTPLRYLTICIECTIILAINMILGSSITLQVWDALYRSTGAVFQRMNVTETWRIKRTTKTSFSDFWNQKCLQTLRSIKKMIWRKIYKILSEKKSNLQKLCYSSCISLFSR